MKFEEKYISAMDNIEFSKDFINNTSALLSAAIKKKERNIMHNKRTIKIIAVAAALVIFSVTAGAAFRLILPKGLSDSLGYELGNIKTVVDADYCDENSLKTVQKTYSDDKYAVTFEAVAQGKALREFRYADGDEMIPVESGLYAIFTIRRVDGGTVMSAEDGKGLEPFDLGYIVLIKGYYTNPSMLADCEHYNMGTYEEDNVLYVACDITNAEIFADEELYIAITDDMVINYETVGMTRDGEFYYTDGYDGIRALFDFDLDNSLADREKAEAYKADHPFMNYDEFNAELAKSLAELENETTDEDEQTDLQGDLNDGVETQYIYEPTTVT